MNTQKASSHLEQFISRMEMEHLHPSVIESFSYYYNQIVSDKTGLIYDKEILPVQEDELPDFTDIQTYRDAGKQFLNKSVRIILNGGLGTSMGLSGPKSLLKVKNNQSFLDILVKRAERQQSKLAIMNSFSTNESTLLALSKMGTSLTPLIFLQNRFPKILRRNLTPAQCRENPLLEWNPPGHGDLYTALFISGILQQLLENDIEYAFISNSDNLGATLDESLLGYFAKKNLHFMMEVAQKTPSDIKGGHLARQHNGRFILRESSQCPENELDAFQDINRYRFFNTNNIWVHLPSLYEQIMNESFLRLPIILNPKTLDPKDETSEPVFQIETAMGAAISLFENSQAVIVPRTRFFPVKKCNELLAIRSDCFFLSVDGILSIHPERRALNLPDSIDIKLDPRYYNKINLFEERFNKGIPSLLRCESLVIEGNVFFEKHVKIIGQTLIKQSGQGKGIIEEGRTLEGEIIL